MAPELHQKTLFRGGTL